VESGEEQMKREIVSMEKKREKRRGKSLLKLMDL